MIDEWKEQVYTNISSVGEYERVRKILNGETGAQNPYLCFVFYQDGIFIFTD